MTHAGTLAPTAAASTNLLKIAEVAPGPLATMEVYEDGMLATIAVYATDADLPEQAEANTRYFRGKDSPHCFAITRTSWR